MVWLDIHMLTRFTSAGIWALSHIQPISFHLFLAIKAFQDPVHVLTARLAQRLTERNRHFASFRNGLDGQSAESQFCLYNVRVPEPLSRMKLDVPRPRPDLVPMPELIEQLNQGLQVGHKLTLLHHADVSKIYIVATGILALAFLMRQCVIYTILCAIFMIYSWPTMITL